MTKDELKVELLRLKFDYWKNEEYNRDEFRGRIHLAKGEKIFDGNIDVLVDYYNVRVIWYYAKGKKVSKSYYVKKEIADFKDLTEMLSTFFTYCIDFYKIDINN